MSPHIWVVIAATALSSFFALTGYALRAFRRVELEEAFVGETNKRRLELLDGHLDALRLTCSLLRTLANLALVVAVVRLFGVGPGDPWSSFMLPILVALGVIALCGVAIPHTWAGYAGEQILAVSLTPLLVLRYALWPVIAAMQILDVPIRRLSGAAEQAAENGDSAKQEILQAASEGQAEGAVEPEEVEMIESVMELADTHAGEIMTPRTDIVALPIETTFAEACRRITEAGHTRVPVYEEDLDNIVGVLYAKDLLQYTAGGNEVELRDIMRKPFFVPESKLLDDLLTEFKARKFHIAIVLDEYGGTAGLVTIEDVLEEIVGDISDEYDKPAPLQIKRLDETTAELDGRAYIDDLNDELQLKIPEDEDYDTAAGLVVNEMGHIPAAGETIEAYSARFTVLEADERKITRLRVEVIEEGEEEDES
ncbi:MAG: hemolysin family protein [Planctomycetota bacterium]